MKELKKELEASKENLTNYVTELDLQLVDIQAKINNLKEMILNKEEEISAKSLELDEALVVQQAQYEAMKSRIKFMYEKGDMLYLELVFAADSFGDMLNKAEYIEMLSAYDRKMLDEYVAYAEYVALCKEGLEEEKAVLDEAKTAVEEEEKALNELIATKEQEVYKLAADIKDKESAIQEYQAEIASQNETIAALEAAVAEERKRLAQEQAGNMTGEFLPGRRPHIQEFRMNMEIVCIPLWGLKDFIMDWIWQHQVEARFLLLIMELWWRQTTAVVWETIS